MFLEGVGDVFEEDEAEDDVLVFRRVHVVAELVGGEPELGLEADGGGGLGSRRGFDARHDFIIAPWERRECCQTGRRGQEGFREVER